MTKLTIPELKNKIKSKSEKELRELLIILFEELGFKEVTHSHGPTEFGKDIVFYDVDKLGNEKWTACVVKADNVNQSNYNEIVRQVNECFKRPYNSHSKGRVRIDEVYVLTSGIYKSNTRELIAEEIEVKTKNVVYKDLGDIVKYIDDNNISRYLVEEKDVYLTKYHEHVQDVLNSDNSIKILEADFDLNINSLEKFQIKLRTREKTLKEEASKYIGATANVVNLEIVPDVDKILSSNRAALIQGIATSGKTTILKQIGISQLKRDNSANVFYVELSKLYTKTKIYSILEYIQEDYQKVTGSSSFNINTDNKTLILLDGLDEVVADENKIELLAQIVEIKRTLNAQVILTSRDIEFIDSNTTLKKIFETHELLPLNNNEMIELGRKMLNDDDQTRDFTSLLKRSEIVNSFPKTPLATIILVILFKEKKLDKRELPKNIYELYSKFLDLFLNKWDKTKGISEQFTIKQKEFVLNKIAEHLHKKGWVSISFDDLFEFLRELSLTKPIEGLDDPEEFLTKICQRSHILIKNDSDKTFRFFHLTIQEFLAAGSFRKKDEKVLFENFYDNWWLNPNIFYAGATPDDSDILDKIANLELYPADLGSKMHYVMHTSKVLQAAHLLDRSKRRKVLWAMLKMFDEMNLELIQAFVDIDEPKLKLKERTILDRILWARNFFMEFFASSQFDMELKEIWQEVIHNKTNLSDITQYCLSYCIAVNNKEAKYLTEFVLSSEELNVRWFKVVDVDVNVKRLEVQNEKLMLKVRKKSSKHRKYIQDQFKESLRKHYTSITGLKKK
ncbi:NACHT domain-containing protein [Pontibacter ummariensis]|uniref:NACHT domain-containing protein n=1 Tax=Pontibacter ummariensis TaxID=1610492 RepID=A0A239LCY4_9BACT|nr:NACHT domain-containing protein [Pontibacter ummariensis]PRY03668.1 NACHT domain-containing protein [Pontibacter ummariensis]SNT28165.1 NACHT domain-containing protein [Pontibacter ummariensis]